MTPVRDLQGGHRATALGAVVGLGRLHARTVDLRGPVLVDGRVPLARAPGGAFGAASVVSGNGVPPRRRPQTGSVRAFPGYRAGTGLWSRA